MEVATAHARRRILLVAGCAGFVVWLVMRDRSVEQPRPKVPSESLAVVGKRLDERPQHVRPVASVRPVAAPSPSRGEARRLLGELTRELEAAAVRSRHWERYRRCELDRGEDCQKYRDAALYRALPRLGGEFAARARALDLLDVAEIATAFEAAMLGQDEFERVAALALLRRSTHLSEVALPESSFELLEQRGVAEAQMTLEHRAGRGPVEPRLAARLADVAIDPALDERVRGSALMALSFPATAADAMRVGERWLEADAERLLSPTMLRICVERCGEACRPLEQRLETDPRMLRHAALGLPTSDDGP